MAEIQKMLDRALAVSPTWQVYRKGDTVIVSFENRRPWWKVWEPRLFVQEFPRDEMIVFWQMLAKVSRAAMVREPTEEMLTDRQEFHADYERSLLAANQEVGPTAFASEVAEWGDGTNYDLAGSKKFVETLIAAYERSVSKMRQALGRAADLMFEKGYRKY